MIRISYGSIFEKKCDLLIIPCDTSGGVTDWVLSNLKQNGIPLPDRYIPWGKVSFFNTKLHTENAEIVGYAASVNVDTSLSSREAISSIGKDIHSFCASNKLRQSNIPLLGTGAGGLPTFEAFEALSGSLKEPSDTDIIFEIFIPSLEIYQNISTAYSDFIDNQPSQDIAHPLVFISYASDDRNNAEWVKKLAIKLIENGVDARLDRFHLKAGTDLAQWMTNEVIRADKVLLICDSNYMLKADVHQGGVGWESMIIQGDMLTQGETKSKYIAVVRETEIDKGLPIYMKSKLALHWNKTDSIDEEDFRNLLFNIFDCDMAPGLGDIPDFIRNHLSKGKKKPDRKAD